MSLQLSRSHFRLSLIDSFVRRNVVSVQTHNRLKQQLPQLLRKHAQFQDILNVPQLDQSNNEINEDLDLHTMINRLDRLSHQKNDQLKDFIPGSCHSFHSFVDWFVFR